LQFHRHETMLYLSEVSSTRKVVIAELSVVVVSAEVTLSRKVNVPVAVVEFAIC
jgi:hypothetical protein